MEMTFGLGSILKYYVQVVSVYFDKKEFYW